MNLATQHNIGAFIALATCVFPQAASAAVNGASIDRFAHNMPLSCVMHAVAGAIAGAPTAVSVVAALQHSPDNLNWAPYTPPGAPAAAATPALTAAGTEVTLPVDLSSAQRFIRIVTTPVFTAGNSPSVLVAADIALGGEQLLPAV